MPLRAHNCDPAKESPAFPKEENDAVSALADTALKQGASLAAVRKGNGEQTRASEQIATAVSDMRGRVRETVSASAIQAKGVAVFGREMESLSAQIGRVRAANLSQAETIAALGTSLASSAPYSASEPT